jgi:hypothetical protein
MKRLIASVALGVTLASASLMGGAAQASGIDVDFSFTNVVGNVSGTVTGEIDGLVNNATSAATAVYVDSYPAGLNSFGSYPTPFNVLNWTGATVEENSFTVSGGVVTSAFFSIINGNGVTDQLYLNSACACQYGTGHTNFLDIGSNDSLYVWNVGNLNASDGLILSSVSATPLPSTWTMLIAGFVGLFGFVAFGGKKRNAAATAAA